MFLPQPHGVAPGDWFCQPFVEQDVAALSAAARRFIGIHPAKGWCESLHIGVTAFVRSLLNGHGVVRHPNNAGQAQRLVEVIMDSSLNPAQVLLVVGPAIALVHANSVPRWGQRALL